MTDPDRRYQLRDSSGVIQTQRVGINMQHLMLLRTTRSNSDVRQGVGVPLVFSTKNIIFYSCPALEPEYFSRHVRKGKYCRAVVIMHPNLVLFVGQYTYLMLTHSYTTE